MKKNKIPQKVKDEALEMVVRYNEQNNAEYQLHFRGQFAYLERIDNNIPTKIGRLRYMPKKKAWNFAVFKYSNEKYDPDEWMFPGWELLDGTIEGAMKAGMEIYPPSPQLPPGINFGSWGCNPVGCLLAVFIIPIQIVINLFKKLFGR